MCVETCSGVGGGARSKDTELPQGTIDSSGGWDASCWLLSLCLAKSLCC